MGKEEIVDFLRHLTKQISEPILLIWDRLPGHRSRVAQDYLASLNGKISAFYLPAYAPELNPVEYIWAHLKQHELGNFCLGISGICPLARAQRCDPCNVAGRSSQRARTRLPCSKLSLYYRIISRLVHF